MESFNIVDLIENNPITKLSVTYQNKLLTKIQSKFSPTEQQIFVASFYVFLKYDPNNDFVIDLDDVWKWLEFSTKQKAKMLLENHFVKDKDYIASLNLPGKQSEHTRGGHNKEIIMLNVSTFKKFCLKAGTKKADDIHDYYIKLEDLLHEVVQEESAELKTQLEQSQIQLQQNQIQLDKSEKTAEKIREKTLLEQFGRNTQCVYYGSIDNVSDTNERLLKFGNSNNLVGRVTQHKETYTNFRLLNAFKVDNKTHVENEMKEHPLFIERQRTITIKSKKYIELLSMNELTFTILDKTIREIIISNECNPENFKKLLEENKLLNSLIKQHYNFNHMNELILLRDENKKLKSQNLRIIKKYKSNSVSITHDYDYESYSDYDSDYDSDSVHVTNQEVLDYGIVVNQIRKKRRDRHEDGFFHIEGRLYPILEGTRNEVWEGKAYQTSGGLIKTDFVINQHGKIVSKCKSIDGIINNKLDIVNQRKRDRNKDQNHC